MTPLRICIGYDSREPIALQVCASSLMRHASAPLSIVPLALNHLKGVYTREPNGTTEFSLTRFLTPYLSGYEGMSVFMDCDMLAQTDIYRVFDDCDAWRATGQMAAVYCCQHDYTPREGLKATGVQTTYPRKNWSSFMVFDNAQCRALTPEYVNHASPADLHRMVWADDKIGSISINWNWLVGEYEPNPEAKILHYTLGTPCFQAYKRCDQADLWWAEYARMNTPVEDWIAPIPQDDLAKAIGHPYYPMRNL